MRRGSGTTGIVWSRRPQDPVPHRVVRPTPARIAPDAAVGVCGRTLPDTETEDAMDVFDTDTDRPGRYVTDGVCLFRILGSPTQPPHGRVVAVEDWWLARRPLHPY